MSFKTAAKRRRSSLGLQLLTAKAGVYGTFQQQVVEFAPNVTPITYEAHGDSGFNLADYEIDEEDDHIFPAAQDLGPPEAKRRRQAPGRRRSQGYIPRPANAFILFRRDFVYQKNARLPEGTDVKHSTLSKIIGGCWRALPQAEKNKWKAKAERVRQEHLADNPGYKYQPKQKANKSKQSKPKARSPTTEGEEANRKCEEVAQMLIEGKKGQEISEALKEIEEQAPMDVHLVCPQPTRKYARKPVRDQRRSSSVPLPDAVGGPFLSQAPPHNAFLTGDRFEFGRRRSSSVDRYVPYLPAPSGEVVFSNPFAPIPSATASLPRPSLSPTSSVGDLRPMDTSMFDPSFMKAAEQNMFPIATTRYIDERIAPHEMPSNYMPIDPVLLQQSMEGGYSTHQQFAVPPSVPTFQSEMPQHMYMPQAQNPGMDMQDPYNDLWKSFTAGKSFSLDALASHHDRNTPSGWYDASSSTSPEYPPNMMASSTSNADYESYDMYSNDVQPMM